jgi:hypothetical protein
MKVNTRIRLAFCALIAWFFATEFWVGFLVGVQAYVAP